MVAPGLVTHTDPPTHSLTAWILVHCVSLHASVYCETCLSLGLTQATREREFKESLQLMLSINLAFHDIRKFLL